MTATARRRELLRTADAQLDVIVEGAGPAVVLLPSSLRDSEDFDELAGLLAAQGLQVLRPQPRGMGASSPPVAGMTLATLAGDVAEVIRQFAGAPAVVAGHAYGHWIARVTDALHPTWVRGVAVMAAAAREFPRGMSEALAIASDPERPDEERLQALSICMFAPGHDPTPWLRGWHPQWRAAYRAAGQQPPREQWVAHAPLLDLQAALDPWRPPATRDELRLALGERVTVRVIADASHALIPEQPQAVAAALVDWMRTLP